jgi:hypothetical protein
MTKSSHALPARMRIYAPGMDAMPFTDVERYHFDLYGYVVRRGVLDVDELDALLDAVEAMQLPSPGTTIQSQRFSGFLDGAQAFRDLLDHPAALAPVLELCGPKARLDHAYGIIMGPGTSGLGLHGGGTPHDPAQFYEVRGGRMYNGLVGVQWALVDHPPGEGGFCCIPGSHRANFALPAAAGVSRRGCGRAPARARHPPGAGAGSGSRTAPPGGRRRAGGSGSRRSHAGASPTARR